MLQSNSYKEYEDLQLIDLIKKGNRNALEKLIQRHYPYIYNLALKFFNNVQDAEDAAQEVTIKLITKIDSYNSQKSKLRTWLYRIVFNHFLNAKKSGPEKVVVNGFTTFFNIIENIPDGELTDYEELKKEELFEETKVACMSGMLMCLNREQRLTYIIGDLFNIDHNLASDIFNITPVNFRKRLSRARKDLYKWMTNKCGLVNKDNPCRCPKKTKGFIEAGFVNADTLKWNTNFKTRIHEISENQVDNMLNESDMIYHKLFREHPFKETQDRSKVILNEILNNKKFSETFDLS